MKSSKFLKSLLCISIFFYTNCSHRMNKEENALEWYQESYKQDLYEKGIFVNDKGIINVKIKDKPFIAILDILAYKLRFNYTLSTDMHNFTLSIYERSDAIDWIFSRQIAFENANAFLMYAIDRINENYIPNNSKVTYRWTGDGPEFYRIINKSDKYIVVKEKVIIKKIFFNSVAVKEYNQNKSQDLPMSAEDVNSNENIDIDIDTSEDENIQPSSAKTVKDKINSLLSNNEKKQVNILELETQNALLLRGDRSVINNISNIIYSMDVEYPQVLVETKVFEYDDSIAKKIGTAVKYANNYNSNTKSSKYDIITNLYEDMYGSDNITTKLPFFSVGLNKLSGDEIKMQLLTQLAMYGSNGIVKILAEPRLLLKPGSKASIRLTTVKYVDATAQELTNIESQSIDCGILFEIIPIVLANDKIMLKIKLKQSEFIKNNEEKIVQSKNENIIDTTVVALDGELINIGGIILKKSAASSSGIPYLKNIPYLGSLFGSKRKDSSKVRIEFMIKPTVKFLSQKLRIIKKDIHKQDKLFQESMKKYFSF